MRDAQLTDEIVDEAEEIPAASDSMGDSAGEDEKSTATEIDDRIGELEREITLERDKYLRLAAEFDNYRKRMMKERAEAESRGQADLISHLLDPMDDIARFAHVDPEGTDAATVVEGVEMVERKLEKSLRAAGLEVVNPVDETFDPSFHEAVATEPTDDPALDHTVSRVYQVGYAFKGQLLRPARVVVRQTQ